MDVLAQIPGYRVNLTELDARAVLDRCGYVHLLADETHAPLDSLLFRFRQANDAQGIPELVIASLLAKKVAVRLEHVCLDVRIAPHGNLGANWVRARQHAETFSRVAHLLGIRAVCFLTDGAYPYQPYIGRGESLIALHQVLTGTMDPWVRDHAAMCFDLSRALEKQEALSGTGDRMGLRRHFLANLAAQGGSWDAFEERVAAIQADHKYECVASRSGYVGVRIGTLRQIIITNQALHVKDDSAFPDGMGVILKLMPGTYVQRGDVMATARTAADVWRALRCDLEQALVVTDVPSSRHTHERV